MLEYRRDTMKEYIFVIASVFSYAAALPVSTGCPDGWMPNEDSCYKYVIGNDMSADTAAAYCAEQAQGGHLVSIDSYPEFKFLISNAKKATIAQGANFNSYDRELWWTSGKWNEQFQDWFWVGADGKEEPFDQWDLWYPGEPNNDGGYDSINEDRINLLLLDGDWGLNDINHSSKLRSICEVEPDYGSSGDFETHECPGDWKANGNSCYKFVVDNDQTADGAAQYCQQESQIAHLVSIDNRAEFDYLTEAIKEALDEADQYMSSRELWWTSGQKDEDGNWYWRNHLPFDKSECKTSLLGTEYSGTLSTTASGKTCQRWDSQYPHEQTRGDYFHNGADNHGNYCRNPDGEPGGPWCYTTDPNTRWDYCKVQMCPTDAPLEWALWYPGEPNDDGYNENNINLLLLYGTWGLNDVNESNTLRFICEIDKTQILSRMPTLFNP